VSYNNQLFKAILINFIIQEVLVMAYNDQTTMTVLHLQGDNQTPSYVKCGTNKSLLFGGSQPYTLTARINFQNLSGMGTIMGKLISTRWDGSGTPRGYCVLPMGGAFLRAYRSGEPYDCDAKNALVANTWLTIVATFDGSTLTLYIDAKEVGSARCFKAINPAGEANFLIGTCYRGSVDITGTMPGGWLIDNMAVLDGCLPPEEISMLSNLKEANLAAPILALWDFTTGTAKDLSGNGNDGTLMGTAKFIQAP
jgi:hypothetical protein